MKQGKLVSWKADKGYGFIAPEKGGAQVFVHISVLSGRGDMPVVGEVLRYEEMSVDGRLRATRAWPASLPSHYSPQTKQRAISLLIILLFFGFMAYLAHGHYIHKEIVYFYLGASIFTFLVYAKDKWSAKSGYWRVSESNLQWLAFMGGWPGALLDQYFLRHKSAKQDFIIIFLAMTFLNLTVLGFYIYVILTGRMPGSVNELARMLRGVS